MCVILQGCSKFPCKALVFYDFERDGGQHVCLQMVLSKFAFSGSQNLKIFLPRRGGASGRRGLAPQGRRGQDFTIYQKTHLFLAPYRSTTQQQDAAAADRGFVMATARTAAQDGACVCGVPDAL